MGQVAKRYNAESLEGMRDWQHTHSHRAPLALTAEHLAELMEVVRGPAPEGDSWIGCTVAADEREARTPGQTALRHH